MDYKALKTRARQMRCLLERAAIRTAENDSELMEAPGMCPAWAAGKQYGVGDIIYYDVNVDGKEQLYRVVQAHKSQDNWRPDTLPALYQAINFTDDDVPIWTQPQGAHNAYAKRDIVEHKGQRWISTVDGNVWEPGVHGWDKI